MSTSTSNTKKTSAPKTLRATKPARKKSVKGTKAQTAKAATELAGRWQVQMKKYQKNLETLVGDLKTLDKEAAKKMIHQAQTLGEQEWNKIRKNVEAPMEHFLSDLHNAKQNLIRDSEEMVRHMRARLRLLQKQVKKSLKPQRST